MSLQKISVKQEPEIQFDAQSVKNLELVKKWLLDEGGKVTKTVEEDSPYFDTKNNRLIREGVECRLKEKGCIYRTDLKTPLDTNERIVTPDNMGVIWRNEICISTSTESVALSEFSDLPILEPLKSRVSDIFEKQLHVKFRAKLNKTKIEREIGSGDDYGLIEYSLQQGYMTTPDGAQKSRELFILEIELREGSEKVLATAIEEFKGQFPSLDLLEERKVMIGFKFIEPNMTEKARSKFEKLQRRLPSPVLRAA